MELLHSFFGCSFGEQVTDEQDDKDYQQNASDGACCGEDKSFFSFHRKYLIVRMSKAMASSDQKTMPDMRQKACMGVSFRSRSMYSTTGTFTSMFWRMVSGR